MATAEGGDNNSNLRGSADDKTGRIALERKRPVKEITMALLLLILGAIGVSAGLSMVAGKIGDNRLHGVFIALLASMVFIPGLYYSGIAWYAYKGYKGFSFSSIPAV